MGLMATVTTLGIGLWQSPRSLAADIVCRGVMFGDTDFAAYHGEVGFGRIELTFRRNGRTVAIPLQYAELNSQNQAVFRGNNPESPSDIVEVVAPRNVQAGTAIRAIYNGNAFTGTCASNLPPQTGDPTPPSQGTWSGLGTAANRLFSSNQSIESTLNYNRNNFSINFFVPPGTGAQVNYRGRIDRLSSTGPNPNSFLLEGGVEAFASSNNGLRVDNTRGNCRIEVFDARIVSARCTTRIPDSNTDFTGRREF